MNNNVREQAKTIRKLAEELNYPIPWRAIYKMLKIEEE